MDDLKYAGIVKYWERLLEFSGGFGVKIGFKRIEDIIFEEK